VVANAVAVIAIAVIVAAETRNAVVAA